MNNRSLEQYDKQERDCCRYRENTEELLSEEHVVEPHRGLCSAVDQVYDGPKKEVQ